MATTVTQRFDSLAFLNLARELADQGGDEARLRTAVGRAYYALFLIAREKTNVRAKQGIHEKVINELKKQPRNRALADQLDTLRKFRLLADYDLLPAEPIRRDWVWNWSRTRSLVDWILPRLQAL